MAYNSNNPNGSATSANSAPVVIASDQATVPVSLASVPSHAVTNVGTFATQVTTINSVAPAFGTGVRGATVQRVTIATDDVVPVSQSGSWSLSANQSVNVAQMNGVTTSMGAGANGTGVQRVTLATDQTAITTAGVFSVKIDQTTPGTTNLVALAANQSVNVAQINGVTTTMGNGASGTGVQRVTIASDSTGVVGLNTGTNTVGAVNVKPTTTGGLTTYHLVSAATTNATNIKNAAGQVFGWYIYNSNAAARKVAFHNSASAPTAGASIFFTLVVPPTSAANVEFTNGIAFSSGIGITTVTDLTDAGTTAVAANDLIINIFYA